MYAQLMVDIFQVKINRILANGQHPSNALVAQAMCDQAKDLFFPPRQCHQRRGCLVVGAALVSHGGYYSPNSMALKIMLSALAEP